jgi:hypothetical protein
VLSGAYFVAAVALGIGEVAHDYLGKRLERRIQDFSLAEEPVR